MNIWYLVLLWFIGYTGISYALRATNRVSDRYTLQGPITLIHTQRGLDAVESLAQRFPRFWSLWGKLGVATFACSLLAGTAVLFFSARRLIKQPSTSTIAKDPQNMLVIPGVNDYLPLSAAPELLLALTIAMVIHELGHAIYCRVGDIDIKSSGLAFLALLPMGAFVEPDEESQENAPRWERIQMVSAGVMNNFAAAAVAMLILILVVPAIIAPAPGAAIGGVTPDSPASESGIEAGDRIVSVSGTAINGPSDLKTQLQEANGSTVQVTTDDGDQLTINRRVFVTRATSSAEISIGDTITHVDGTTVATTGDFVEAIQQAKDPVIELTSSDGETHKHIAGARANTAEGSPLASYATDGVLYITHVNDNRVYDAASLREALNAVDSDNSIQITGLTPNSDGYESFTTTYDASETTSSIAVTSGVGGLVTADVGVQFFPADQYLGYLTADGLPLWGAIGIIILLPFATVGGLPYNFAGFTPDIVGFYEVTSGLEPVAPMVFFLVSLVFWTAWINMNLALFNCFPTFALDGGHYTRYGLEEIAARCGASNPKQATKRVSQAVMAIVLAGIAVIVVVPPIFG